MLKRNLSKLYLIPTFVLMSISLVIAQSPSGSPRQEKLLNGLKVLLWNDAKADKVSVKIRIHSGAAFDPQGKEGVMKLLAANIFPNKETRDFFAEDLGGGLEVISNYDYIQINASSTPDQFLTMLETLSTAVSNPPIEKETIPRLRGEQAEKLKLLSSDPAYLADQAARKRLFGTFPYGRPDIGTADSLSRIDLADLIDAKQRFLTADNATIAISGNFEPNLAYRAVRRYFGSWLKTDKRVPSTFRQPDPPERALLTIQSPTDDRFELRYIARGYAVGDKDFPASAILARILEDRIRARVPAEYRPGVSIRSESHVLPGAMIFAFSGSGGDDHTPKIEANDIVSQAISARITDAEFNAARSALQVAMNNGDVVDRWLDIDTFRTPNPDAARRAFADIAVADAQRVADRLAAQPMAVIALVRGKQSN